jgi:hypothetical protein
VEDGYIPPNRVKSAAQKEARRNNALALEIIQEHPSEAMKKKMETITSAKELWLSLDQTFEGDERGLVNMMLEDMTDDMKSEVKGYTNFIQLVGYVRMLEPEKPSNIEVSDSEESSNIEVSNSDTGKYTGIISEPLIDLIENDCSKVECFYSQYIPENENEESKVERCFHSHYSSESENEKSTCYHTSSDFENDECGRIFRHKFHEKNSLVKECDTSNNNVSSVEASNNKRDGDSKPTKLMFMAMNSTSAPDNISEDEVDVSEQLNNALEELGSVKLKCRTLKEENKDLRRKFELQLEASRRDNERLLQQLQQREQVIERLQA